MDPTATYPRRRDYLAGSACAKADRSHGMSLRAMLDVPQDDDSPAWAAGYIDRTMAYRASQGLPRTLEGDTIRELAHQRRVANIERCAWE